MAPAYPYVHAAIPGAVTAVPSAAFVSGRPVARPMSAILRKGHSNAPPARIKSCRSLRLREAPRRDIVRGLPPSVRGSAPAPSVRPGEINRFPASGGVREQAPVMPNTNVVQPPVRQDPNPVAGRPRFAVAAGPAGTTAPGAATTVRRAARQVSPDLALRSPASRCRKTAARCGASGR